MPLSEYGARIERRVIEDDREAAVVETFTVRPSVSEDAVERILARRSVIHTAVDQETF